MITTTNHNSEVSTHARQEIVTKATLTRKGTAGGEQAKLAWTVRLSRVEDNWLYWEREGYQLVLLGQRGLLTSHTGPVGLNKSNTVIKSTTLK